MRKAHLFAGLVAAVIGAGSHAMANSIVNGDFEAGANGFSTGYILDSSAGAGLNAGSLQGAGYYGIVTSSQSWHPYFTDFGDHTTGSGNFMIVNADNIGTTTVWEESGLNVIPGLVYQLDFWARSAYPVSPATLHLSASVNALDTEFDLSSNTSAWQHFSMNFVATSSPTTVSIVDTNTQLSGNDFALDDISLNLVGRPPTLDAATPVPLPASAWGGGMLIGAMGLMNKLRPRMA